MKVLNELQNIIHSDFLCNDLCFEEKEASMRIEINKRGCQCLVYKFDKQLGREYKGGLFPFFAKVEGVCKISDYIVFAERNHKLYCIIVEMKRGKAQTFPQLKAAHEFVKFIIATLNRVNQTNYNPEVRFLSIHNNHLLKRNICEDGFEYDVNNHHIVKSTKMKLVNYLK